jgi:hypothetical protein
MDIAIRLQNTNPLLYWRHSELVDRLPPVEAVQTATVDLTVQLLPASLPLQSPPENRNYVEQVQFIGLT